MPAAAPLAIAPDDLAQLRRWARSSQLPTVLVQRARILLLAAAGVTNIGIAERVGVSRPTVLACRRRYGHRGLAGVPDRPRPGRPQTVRRSRRAEILAVTLNPPPPRLGITHWSTRLLAASSGSAGTPSPGSGASTACSPGEWRRSSSPPIRSWRPRSMTLSACTWIPRSGRWCYVDEKSQIQALERTRPIRWVWPGRSERRTHDYLRHGTTTLFAALEVATGRVTNQCAVRHRHQEFLAFLKQVARSYPRRQLHVICDNYATHKHPVVRGWLAKQRRIRLHFIPTSASWLNLVEVYFSILDRQALRRGDFPVSAISWLRSTGSARPGMSTASRSLGPSPPRRSWPSSNDQTAWATGAPTACRWVELLG
jgi:transposase